MIGNVEEHEDNVTTDTRKDMADYDRLPQRVRNALKDAKVNISTQGMLAYLSSNPASLSRQLNLCSVIREEV